jgi:hypothetical protein
MSVQLDQPVTCQITLSCGNVLIVDAQDLHHVNASTWRFMEKNAGKFYLVRGPRKDGVRYLHRLIINAQSGETVDHINGNTLDNRRSNLRIVTQAQNNMNRRARRNGTSKFKGVQLCKSTGRWRAMISDGSRYKHIGRFDKEVEAAYAYDLESLRHHGNYGCRNFLPLV